MKTLKQTYQIRDNFGGFKYLVVATSRTHYMAIDQFGDVVTIHKTQATRI